MQEVEGDKEMRSRMKLYGKPKKQNEAAASMDVDSSRAEIDDEFVKLEELITEMGIGLSEEVRILTTEESAAIAPMNLGVSEAVGAAAIESAPFNDGKFDPSSFKFV